MQIITGVQKTALKVVIYGPEGIGKSTFASQFPRPLFLDTEGSTRHMDVSRTPRPTSWAMLMDQVGAVEKDPGLCGTLVLDTADWAEQLCSAELCAKNQKSSIEEFGYGKGYTYLGEEFGRLLNRLEGVVDRGVNVVITAHARMRKFEQPDEMGAYDRWELKLSKQTAPLVKEWADLVLFANYKTYPVKTKEGKVKAQGGKRVMYTAHHPCWDAKNRLGLPEELPFEFESIRSCVPGGGAEEKVPGPQPPLPAAPAPEPQPQQWQSAPEPPGLPAYLKPLYDLMNANNVSPDEVEAACVTKGYAPQDLPLDSYPEDFVTGVLVAAWSQVYGMILENRPVPF
ncbi:MAG: ATP-binding protein [Lawsonibacter sp.]|jgi:hypothetical protein|nr:ATP-binding protein [Lawsonibacter sp.]